MIEGLVDGDDGGRVPPGVDVTDQPIELLVQLAEEGEIDPWDLDLIAVTDAFLERIDEEDLVVTARTLFYASVLLRMKSDAIAAASDPEPEARPPEPTAPEAAGDPLGSLEREMDRRLTRKAARGTPSTLTQLIHELRAAERERYWKESRTYDTSRGNGRGPQTLAYRTVGAGEGAPSAVDSVSSTSHREGVEAVIDSVVEHLRSAFGGGEGVPFETVAAVGPSTARTYQALVFLEHRRAVELDQRRPFEALTVRPGPDGLDAAFDRRE
ncbi:MAG: segregation/condensation protein A [Halobacteriales archaeon]